MARLTPNSAVTAGNEGASMERSSGAAQAAADLAEADAVRRYARQRQFAGLVAEAIARAEGMGRLEMAPRTQPRKTTVRDL